MKTRAAVQLGDRTIEMRTFDVPDLDDDHALLRVEANGICGTDYEIYEGSLTGTGVFDYPLIPGHEPVGTIDSIGARAAELWDLEAGDRVAVEAYVPCHVCRPCRLGRTKFCAHRFVYGFTSVDLAPGLWGGFAEHMVLRPNTVLHRVPDGLSREDAVLFNPLGGGFAWVHKAGTGIGDTVLVLGPGQRGLACVLAARQAGAASVIVTGLGRDRPKLELARSFGADEVVVADEEDVVERVQELTDGDLVDQVIDTTPYATSAIMQAVRCVRPGGTIVLGGVKGMRTVDDFVSDEVVLKDLVIHGAVAADSWAYERAIELIASGRHPLGRLHTHSLPLEDVEHGLHLLGGSGTGEPVIHITITP